MSITFFADLGKEHFTTRKVFAEEKYEGLDSFKDAYLFENDPFYFRDEETSRFYSMEQECSFKYEVNMANDTFNAILQNLDRNMYIQHKANDCCGSLEIESMPSFRRKLIFALNGPMEKGTFEEHREGNFFHCGINSDRLKRNIQEMLDIIETAQQKGCPVYWS